MFDETMMILVDGDVVVDLQCEKSLFLPMRHRVTGLTPDAS
jgi:hypothetical protein